MLTLPPHRHLESIIQTVLAVGFAPIQKSILRVSFKTSGLVARYTGKIRVILSSAHSDKDRTDAVYAIDDSGNDDGDG